jgi:hypothetical protein
MTQKILKILTGVISISLPIALIILFSLGYLQAEALGVISLIIIGELILITWFLIHIIYREETRTIAKKNIGGIENQVQITQSGSPLIMEKN